MPVPLRLPGKTWTDIIERKVNEALDHWQELADGIFPDGRFPFTQDLPGPQSLRDYILKTEYVADLALLRDPDYVDKYQAGILPAPQSHFWVTALSVPSTFEELQKDFMRLAGAA